MKENQLWTNQAQYRYEKIIKFINPKAVSLTFGEVLEFLYQEQKKSNPIRNFMVMVWNMIRGRKDYSSPLHNQEEKFIDWLYVLVLELKVQ